MPSQRTKRGRAKRVADMRMHVGGRPRADRQSMWVVERNKVAGSMDGMPNVLGTTGDMPFVGSDTRARADEIQEERAAEMSVPGWFDGSGGDHHVPRG